MFPGASEMMGLFGGTSPGGIADTLFGADSPPATSGASAGMGGGSASGSTVTIGSKGNDWLPLAALGAVVVLGGIWIVRRK